MPVIIDKSGIPASCGPDVPVVFGIDEAGRGPLLGPMVYGCAYWPLCEEDEWAKSKYNDSKALKEHEREALFHSMCTTGRIGWMTHSIPAKDISSDMLRRMPVSLNAISHDAAMNMLEQVLAQGVRVERVFVDTVGDPGDYERKLNKFFNTGAAGGGGVAGRGWPIHFTVSKKADSLFKTVSAASIAAKVIRDKSIRDWVFDEPALKHITKPSKAAGAAGAASSAAAAAVVEEEDEEDEDDKVVASKKKSSSSSSSSSSAAASSSSASSSSNNKRQRPVVADSDDDETAAAAGVAYDDEDEDGAASAGGEEDEVDSAEEAVVAQTGTKKTRVPLMLTQQVGLHPSVGGSGYPSDPRTVEWMRANLDPVFGWPNIVRFSWKPAKLALEGEKAVGVDWGEEKEGEEGEGEAKQSKLSSFFKSTSTQLSTAGLGSKGRALWLRRRNIEPVLHL